MVKPITNIRQSQFLNTFLTDGKIYAVCAIAIDLKSKKIKNKNQTWRRRQCLACNQRRSVYGRSDLLPAQGIVVNQVQLQSRKDKNSTYLHILYFFSRILQAAVWQTS